jgi:hypothetical protein
MDGWMDEWSWNTGMDGWMNGHGTQEWMDA